MSNPIEAESWLFRTLMHWYHEEDSSTYEEWKRFISLKKKQEDTLRYPPIVAGLGVRWGNGGSLQSISLAIPRRVLLFELPNNAQLPPEIYAFPNSTLTRNFGDWEKDSKHL
ncbi:hypothetical protein A2U01_0061821 [Trifolium medium]|uniref:Uncharacterized protein n=1 Tax=Trifolium medium TaxID=97028 RepID=A0A392RVD4_9FABA|nr:hypothetical protein [Trifolium medium]